MPLTNDALVGGTGPMRGYRTTSGTCRGAFSPGPSTSVPGSDWLRMLIAPGGSLGGARPKASVVDPQGQLWIAKFPSARDEHDVGAWELLVQTLARRVAHAFS